MIKRRAAAAGLPPSTCCHTFRATGITAYLANGGTLEHAQQIAGHASPKTTKLCDRDGADTITLDENPLVNIVRSPPAADGLVDQPSESVVGGCQTMDAQTPGIAAVRFAPGRRAAPGAPFRCIERRVDVLTEPTGVPFHVVAGVPFLVAMAK